MEDIRIPEKVNNTETTKKIELKKETPETLLTPVDGPIKKDREDAPSDNSREEASKLKLDIEKEFSHSFERELVISSPEFVGINFDQDYIVDAKNFWSPERYLQYVKEKGDISEEKLTELVKSGEGLKMLSQRREKETEKSKAFEEYLSGFAGNLKHARIHPAGENSPVSPSEAIEIKGDGAFDVAIAPQFTEQIRALQEQNDDLDLTVVVPFYDYRRGKEKASNVPETQEQVGQYIAICKKIVESAGENVQLEIGNETNVSRDTNKLFAEMLDHASKVDPVEYGKFFFKVAKVLKEERPAVRLKIAGTASFDPTYLIEVLTEVKKLQGEAGIDVPLVDTIDFHPYRERPEEGSAEVKNGEFVDGKLNYEQQMEEMQKIANDFGVKLIVGEINWSLENPERETKLQEAISLTKEQDTVSFMYPAANVHHGASL
jgi:hypothetical protein